MKPLYISLDISPQKESKHAGQRLYLLGSTTTTGRERKLAAIMFTDIVGYAAQTQADESRSLEILSRHNRLLRPFFSRFHGREVKTIGDSFLVEFDSALNAVKCAIEIQRFLHDYNVSSKDDWKITLRIGIHLGDVVRFGDDILGDAVNIASRVQPLADPEGVCISEQVYYQVFNKLDYSIERLENPELKNVRFQVNIYKVVMPWETKSNGGQRESLLLTQQQQLDPRRIAVLPFANLSPDAQDEFFADGLTEELIDRLCQVKGLEVIARTSAMNYKKEKKSALQIGRELRAGALVEGSIRWAGNRIRVTAQLINSNTEAHLWSSRYDRELQDIFAVQTDIAEQVASALEVRLLPSETKIIKQKPTENIEAYTLYLRGRFLWNRRSIADVHEALKLFQQAAEKDPKYARAFTGMADCYSILVDRGALALAEGIRKSKEASMRALELDDSLPEAHASLGLALENESEYDRAEQEFKRAIELNPGYASAYNWYSILLASEGKWADAQRMISMAEEADPLSAAILTNSGYDAWFNGNDAKAIEKWTRALEVDPNFAFARFCIASYYIKKNLRQEALAELNEVVVRSSSSSSSSSPKSGGESNYEKGMLAFLYGILGEKDQARVRLESLLAQPNVQPGYLALAYAGVGDIDKFFEYLNRGRPVNPAMLRSYPLFESIRRDPRYHEFMAKLKLKS